MPANEKPIIITPDMRGHPGFDLMIAIHDDDRPSVRQILKDEPSLILVEGRETHLDPRTLTPVTIRRPLLIAAVSIGSVRMTELLLFYGADPNVRIYGEDTPLSRAANSLRSSDEEGSYEDIIGTLLEGGADTMVRDCSHQNTVLHGLLFSLNDDKEVLPESFLRSFSRMVNSNREILKYQNRYGQTLLHLAVQSGSLQMVRLLLEEGSDVSIKDQEGRTPLAQALSKAASGEMVNLIRAKTHLET